LYLSIIIYKFYSWIPEIYSCQKGYAQNKLKEAQGNLGGHLVKEKCA